MDRCAHFLIKTPRIRTKVSDVFAWRYTTLQHQHIWILFFQVDSLLLLFSIPLQHAGMSLAAHKKENTIMTVATVAEIG